MTTPAPHGGMTGVDPIDTAENYRRFARIEAAGRSPAYEALAAAVADDERLLAFLAALPALKRQPNLLFAAARLLLGAPPDMRSLRTLVEERPLALRDTMLERRTQTNEPGRCAVLLPALSSLEGPLALLEVGAAAGLTLLPDVYSYDYGGHLVPGTDPHAPTVRCRPIGAVPLPAAVPEVVWRAGIDLAPLDVSDEADVAWLSCLVWPGEANRAALLRDAVAAARRQPPPIHRGDLLGDLGRVASRAPRGATLVVYHSAVLAYVDEDRRRAFAAAVRDMGAVWLSNEGAGVLHCVGVGGDADRGDGSFLLVSGGKDVLARTDGHGAWVEWVGPERPGEEEGRR